MARREPTGLVPLSDNGPGPALLPVFVSAGLIDERRVANLLERQVVTAPAALQGYRRVEISDTGWALLVPDPGSEVDGSVYLGLGAHDLERLDAYRGVGEGLYRRVSARARIEGRGPLRPVFIYLPTVKTLHRLAVG